MLIILLTASLQQRKILTAFRITVSVKQLTYLLSQQDAARRPW